MVLARPAHKILSSVGNAELLGLSPSKLKKRFICENHFRPEYFLSKNLTSTAVPVKYGFRDDICRTYSAEENIYKSPRPSTSKEEIHFLTPEKAKPEKPSTAASEQILVDITNLPSPSKAKRKLEDDARDTTQTKQLKRKLVETEEKLKKVTYKLQKRSIMPRDLKSLPAYPRALTTMQLYHKPRTPWLSNEKSVALSLYYKSSGTYKFLRTKGVILPSPSTLLLWLKKFKYVPGCNAKLFHCLKLKIETMDEKSRECILAFDEMALKQCIEFSKQKDVIEGFEDLGELGRKPLLAKQALVFILRGIYSNWKIPISFYFSANGVGAEDLLKLLKINLASLKNAGLTPLAVVCDQGSTNQKLYKLLNVTIENPYFIINNTQCYALYDAPHLLKSIRNNLLDGDFSYDDKRISFNDIRNVYEIDKASSTGKALTKITDIHLNPNTFQKMNVRLAVQVLSHSMSSAIDTAVETGQLNSPTAKNTANFIKIMNDAFDALNSRQLKSNKLCNCALSEYNKHPFKALDEAYTVMSSILKSDKKGGWKRPPCFNGFLQTINAVRMLYETQNKKGYPFLLTSRLSQDVLENQFSIYRQRGGYSRNPTVRTFQAAYKSNCIMNLMKPPKTSNYEVPSSSLLEIEDDSTIVDSLSDSDSSNQDLSSNPGSESPPVLHTSLEDCSIMYFSGYLFKKCFDKFKCKDCKITLSEERELINEHDILLFFKSFNINNPCSLKVPSQLLWTVTKISMKLFSKRFNKILSNRKLHRHLLKATVVCIKRKKAEWFCESECQEHRDFILNLLLRTLIYKECKSLSANVKAKTQKKSEKKNIVMNF